MSFFKKMAYSVTSIGMYPKMIKQGVGKAFLYLFLLTLIFGTIDSVVTGYNVNQAVGQFADTLKEEIPEFTLKNGTLQVEGDMPMILQETESSVLAIDTTGQLDESFLNDYESGLLVLKHKAINKKNQFSTEEFSFQQFNLTLTKDNLISWLPYLKWAGVIFGVFAWIFFFIGKMASALFIALIGLIASAVFKAKMPFGQLYTTSIYALTMPILADLIFKLFNMNLPVLVYYVIAVLYMVLAVEKMKRAAE